MFFSTQAMDDIFSPETHIQRMLDFEAALARASAGAGLIPEGAVDAIVAACRVELFDVDRVIAEGARNATAAVPLVKMLTELVDEDARRYVHWGATSQDVIDTAMMLQIRDGLDLLTTGLLNIGTACARYAEEHRRTPMAGRTLLQQALPITFGLKAARWLAQVTRQVLRLQELRATALAVQFGGAAGTLASLGNAGIDVTERLASELGLAAPDLPWHTERDRVAEVASAVGIVAGAMSKIAADLALMVQTEIGEVSEAVEPGKGGSSAMPHKRNPVDITLARASARLALGAVPLITEGMQQVHERAPGEWQAELEAFPALFRHTAAAVERVGNAMQGLVVNRERMQTNLDLLNGLMMAESLTMALAPKLGRGEAYAVVQDACQQVVASGVSLEHAAREDDRIRLALSDADLAHALDPTAYLGSTDTFIDRALAGFRSIDR